MPSEPPVILLVEDNADHSELIQRRLAEHRVANRLRQVADGEAALDYLFRRGAYAAPALSPRPHLILLDLRLPRIDGLQVLATLKADGVLRRIPVVVITTSPTERDLAQAYEHHVNSYLVKPVDFAQFTRLMDDLGYYWLIWNRQP